MFARLPTVELVPAEGMPYRDVAAALGIRLARVQQLEARALRKVRKALGVVIPADIDHENAEVEKSKRRWQRTKTARRRAA